MSDDMMLELLEEGWRGAPLALEYQRRLAHLKAPPPTPITELGYRRLEEVRALLNEELKVFSLRELGERYGCSGQYMQRVCTGLTSVPDSIARQLGYRRVVLYEPLPQD